VCSLQSNNSWKPIVIRLQGTYVAEARTLIDGCGFKMILADDLEDAATKAVGVAEIAAQASKIQVRVKFEGFSHSKCVYRRRSNFRSFRYQC
jgi:hypothetical protein